MAARLPAKAVAGHRSTGRSAPACANVQGDSHSGGFGASLSPQGVCRNCFAGGKNSLQCAKYGLECFLLSLGIVEAIRVFLRASLCFFDESISLRLAGGRDVPAQGSRVSGKNESRRRTLVYEAEMFIRRSGARPGGAF